MDTTVKFLGYHGVIILAVYVLLTFGIILYLSVRKVKGDSLKGFYLSGGGLGTTLLLFTLFATQYSGNTVIGYASRTYRVGYSYFQSIPFFIMVIVGYMLFAPRLHVFSKRFNFITPADWLEKRFNYKPVTLLGTFLMAYGLANYLLEQLVAMGHAISGLTAGTVPYIAGVIALISVMLIYQWIGGMKAVAVADTINGIFILIGVFTFLVLAIRTIGSPMEAAHYIAENAPDKIGVPKLETSINWLSIYILVGIGASVYPHAIQRIYAAKDEATLKTSLKRMAWMPYVTSGFIFLIGITSIKALPNLEGVAIDEVVGILANILAQQSTFHYFMMMILYLGIVGAIMSTSDSVILSLSSLLSNDVYGRFINPKASEKQKVLWGKVAGIMVVMLLLFVAWRPPATLYEIFVLKFEILIQVAPAFILGLYWKKLSKHAVFIGMLVGALMASIMTFTGIRTVYGIHAGVLGLAVNFIICVLGSYIVKIEVKEEEHAESVLELEA